MESDLSMMRTIASLRCSQHQGYLAIDRELRRTENKRYEEKAKAAKLTYSWEKILRDNVRNRIRMYHF